MGGTKQQIWADRRSAITVAVWGALNFSREVHQGMYAHHFICCSDLRLPFARILQNCCSYPDESQDHQYNVLILALFRIWHPHVHCGWYDLWQFSSGLCFLTLFLLPISVHWSTEALLLSNATCPARYARNSEQGHSLCCGCLIKQTQGGMHIIW